MAVPKKPTVNGNTYTEMTVYDESTGEIKFEASFRGSRVRGGWVMMFTDKGFELIASAPSPAVLKVFMYLAMGQTYTTNGLDGGMKTTKANVQRQLNLCKKTVADAFRWLKDNYIIHEWRHNGCPDFMVNPRYVSVGKFDERMKVWTARFEHAMPMYSRSDYQSRKSAQYRAASSTS